MATQTYTYAMITDAAGDTCTVQVDYDDVTLVGQLVRVINNTPLAAVASLTRTSDGHLYGGVQFPANSTTTIPLPISGASRMIFTLNRGRLDGADLAFGFAG